MSDPSSPGPARPPVAFTAPYAMPAPGVLAAPPARRRGRPLGAVALVLAIVAGLLAPAVGGFAAFRIARGAGAEAIARGTVAGVDWTLLSPVRDLVLVAEVSFWAGTVVGITGLVVGIVATARGRGRGAGITAIVLSVLGPALFGVCVTVALVAGAGTLPGLGGTPA